MKTHLLLILLLLSWCTLPIYGASKWKEFTYTSFAARNFSGWPQMLDSFDKEVMKTDDADRQVELFVYYYGYIGHLLDYNRKDEASKWNKRAMKLMKQVKSRHDNDARIVALDAIFLAYDIAISPFRAAFEIPSLFRSSRRALKMDPNCYLAQQMQANLLFYLPETFGGDKQKAIGYYKKVYQYFKSNPQISQYDWMYLNVISTIGNAYEKTGHIDVAISWAKLALQVEPNFMYVRQVLMPRLEKEL